MSRSKLEVQRYSFYGMLSTRRDAKPAHFQRLMFIFDFDGILVDSLQEIAVNAYNCVTGELVQRLDSLPSGCTKLFLRNRFHFQPAGDAVTLMRWCLVILSAPELLLSRAQYLQIVAEESQPLLERTNLFFETRARLVEHDRQHWLSLHCVYEPLWTALVNRGADKLVILTNKNLQAVRELTEFFGLDIVPENVYAGDNGATKIGNLRSLQQRFEQKEYLFIDDNVHNLVELAEHYNGREALGEFQPIQPILGDWGYLGPDDADHGRRMNFRVCSQTDVIELCRSENENYQT